MNLNTYFGEVFSLKCPGIFFDVNISSLIYCHLFLRSTHVGESVLIGGCVIAALNIEIPKNNHTVSTRDETCLIRHDKRH